MDALGGLVPLLVGVAALVISLIVLRLIPHLHTPHNIAEAALRRSSVKPNDETLAACHDLAAALPGKLHRRHDKPFLSSLKSYWDQQEQSIIPAAIATPSTTADVQTAIRILALHLSHSKITEDRGQLRFAVRSGGHSPVPGEANVAGGIVLDLQALKNVSLAPDKRSVHVGPGARWHDVYTALAAHKLAVVGGRASTVGVAGLLLGGGISFFSPRSGFACDNVLAYQVVLASGEVVTASAASHPDLFVALKGGGNNLGVVTSFELRAFPHEGIWGGFTYSWLGNARRYVDVLARFAAPDGHDPDASLFVSLCHESFSGLGVVVGCPAYAKPVRTTPLPFEEFMVVPKLWSTCRPRSLADLTVEIGSGAPKDGRNVFENTVFELDLPTLHGVIDLYESSLSRIKHVRGLIWCIVFHVVPPGASSPASAAPSAVDVPASVTGLVARARPHNAIAVAPTGKTLIICQQSHWYRYAADDSLVSREAARFTADVERVAKEREVWHPFKYANYRSIGQNPLDGYGSEGLECLRRASRMYDPEGMFQRACAGGHKIPGL